MGGEGVPPGDMNQEFVIVKMPKENDEGGGGGQDGCERRIEVIVKMKNKKVGWGPGPDGRGSGWM